MGWWNDSGRIIIIPLFFKWMNIFKGKKELKINRNQLKIIHIYVLGFNLYYGIWGLMIFAFVVHNNVDESLS